MRRQSDEWLLYGAATCLVGGGHGRRADTAVPKVLNYTASGEFIKAIRATGRTAINSSSPTNTSPLWSAYGSDETARLTGSLGMGGLFGSEGGPDRVRELMATYQDALWTAPEDVARNGRRTALMTAG